MIICLVISLFVLIILLFGYQVRRYEQLERRELVQCNKPGTDGNIQIGSINIRRK